MEYLIPKLFDSQLTFSTSIRENPDKVQNRRLENGYQGEYFLFILS